MEADGKETRSIANLSVTFDGAKFLAGLSKVSNERARPQRHYRVERSLLKDSDVSIASSTIPVYRPVLNGRSNAKWIQTAANRVPASYESACWKPPLDVIEFRLNAKRESQNARCTVIRHTLEQSRAPTRLVRGMTSNFIQASRCATITNAKASLLRKRRECRRTGVKVRKVRKVREEWRNVKNRKEREKRGEFGASNAPVRRRIAFSRSRCSPGLPGFGVP